MAYEYKTLIKSEGFDFDFYKNRWNSKTSGVVAINGVDKSIAVAIINSKTGEVKLFDNLPFKEKTIAKVKSKIAALYE